MKDVLESLTHKKQKNSEREAWRSKYYVHTVYFKQMPTSGEFGLDGYMNLLIVNTQTGEKTRMIHNKDVHDSDVFSYPERLEDTERIFELENFTKEEITICRWLHEFGEFSDVARM